MRLRPNPPLQGTPEKLRFSVPPGFRPPVAPELMTLACIHKGNRGGKKIPGFR